MRVIRISVALILFIISSNAFPQNDTTFWNTKMLKGQDNNDELTYVNRGISYSIQINLKVDKFTSLYFKTNPQPSFHSLGITGKFPFTDNSRVEFKSGIYFVKPYYYERLKSDFPLPDFRPMSIKQYNIEIPFLLQYNLRNKPSADAQYYIGTGINLRLVVVGYVKYFERSGTEYIEQNTYIYSLFDKPIQNEFPPGKIFLPINLGVDFKVFKNLLINFEIQFIYDLYNLAFSGYGIGFSILKIKNKNSNNEH